MAADDERAVHFERNSLKQNLKICQVLEGIMKNSENLSLVRRELWILKEIV